MWCLSLNMRNLLVLLKVKLFSYYYLTFTSIRGMIQVKLSN